MVRRGLRIGSRGNEGGVVRRGGLRDRKRGKKREED